MRHLLNPYINAKYKSYINGTFKGNIQLLYEDVIKYNADYNTTISGKELDLSVFPENVEELDKIETIVKIEKPKTDKKKFFEPVEVEEDDDPFRLGSILTDIPTIADINELDSLFNDEPKIVYKGEIYTDNYESNFPF